jgi:hypothetical protein
MPSSFLFTFRRELIELKYDVMKIELELDEHLASGYHPEREVRREYLQAKLNLAKYRVAQLEQQILSNARSAS